MVRPRSTGTPPTIAGSSWIDVQFGDVPARLYRPWYRGVSIARLPTPKLGLELRNALSRRTFSLSRRWHQGLPKGV